MSCFTGNGKPYQLSAVGQKTKHWDFEKKKYTNIEKGKIYFEDIYHFEYTIQ